MAFELTNDTAYYEAAYDQYLLDKDKKTETIEYFNSLGLYDNHVVKTFLLVGDTIITTTLHDYYVLTDNSERIQAKFGTIEIYRNNILLDFKVPINVFDFFINTNISHLPKLMMPLFYSNNKYFIPVGNKFLDNSNDLQILGNYDFNTNDIFNIISLPEEYKDYNFSLPTLNTQNYFMFPLSSKLYSTKTNSNIDLKLFNNESNNYMIYDMKEQENFVYILYYSKNENKYYYIKYDTIKKEKIDEKTHPAILGKWTKINPYNYNCLITFWDNFTAIIERVY